MYTCLFNIITPLHFFTRPITDFHHHFFIHHHYIQRNELLIHHHSSSTTRYTKTKKPNTDLPHQPIHPKSYTLSKRHRFTSPPISSSNFQLHNYHPTSFFHHLHFQKNTDNHYPISSSRGTPLLASSGRWRHWCLAPGFVQHRLQLWLRPVSPEAVWADDEGGALQGIWCLVLLHDEGEWIGRSNAEAVVDGASLAGLGGSCVFVYAWRWAKEETLARLRGEEDGAGDPKHHDAGGDDSDRGDGGLDRRRWRRARRPCSGSGIWLRWRKVVAEKKRKTLLVFKIQ